MYLTFAFECLIVLSFCSMNQFDFALICRTFIKVNRPIKMWPIKMNEI